jgi:HSP20 family protein
MAQNAGRETKMGITDLIPWKKRKAELEIQRESPDAFLDLRRSMDELFDEFYRGFPDAGPLGAWMGAGERFGPRVDLRETPEDVRISAELPGLTSADISVSVSRDSVTISGEKRVDREKKTGRFYQVERAHGSFRRTIPLPAAVDDGKVEASFENGILSVTLPKRQAGSGARQIKITKR